MLANEAVKPERQLEIVELGGLRLLLPLTQSPDADIQRLAAHALANLSVHTDNQVRASVECHNNEYYGYEVTQCPAGSNGQGRWVGDARTIAWKFE